MEQPCVINDQNNSLELAKVALPALCLKHPAEMITFSLLPKLVGNCSVAFLNFSSFFFPSCCNNQFLSEAEALVLHAGNFLVVHFLSPLSLR